MKLRIKDFALTIALLVLFSFSLLGHIVFGLKTYNEEQIAKGFPPLINWTDYLVTGPFLSSMSENMESEFLQMAAFVFLTLSLIQRGSAESNKPKDEKSTAELQKEYQEDQYLKMKSIERPWFWFIYKNSLTLALFFLFIVSFTLHSWGSFKLLNYRNTLNHQPFISFTNIFVEPEFWFESFQNWQSEFFSIAVLVVFTIFLRQKNSPQSKKINESDWKTGSG